MQPPRYCLGVVCIAATLAFPALVVAQPTSVPVVTNQPGGSVPQVPVDLPTTAPVDPAPPIPEGATPVATRIIVHDATWISPTVDLSRPHPTHTAKLVNLSVRAATGSGESTLTAGAGIQGTGTLPLLVRAIGPGLVNFGIADALTNAPELAIFAGQTAIAETNTVAGQAADVADYVGAFKARPSMNGMAVGDSALVGQSPTGILTAQCNASSGAAGVGMVEFYDLDLPGASTRFVNFSARTSVGTGNKVMVTGFIVAGDGATTLLIRGVGLSLRQFGVTNALPDPAIELYSGSVLIASNDNWQSGGQAAAIRNAGNAVGAFALASENEAALLVTLPAGVYTLHLRGSAVAGNPQPLPVGVALAEIYEVPATAFDAARATNTAGLQLFGQLTATTEGNLIISPYSIESAMALAYAGAAGATRLEMANVLALSADNDSLQRGFAALREALAESVQRSVEIAATRTRLGASIDPIQWNVANRLYGQTGFPFREAYLSLMRDGFAAPLQSLDFFNGPELARLAINDWVKAQTKEKILDLIPPGGVTRDSRLVLVNALYLKAPWNDAFPATQTSNGSFHVTSSVARNVPMMNKTASMGYLAEGGATVVTLPYLGNDLQFVIVIPAPGDSVSAFASRLTPDDVARWAQTPVSPVSLSLPKFTVPGGSLSLANALQALGVRSAFNLPVGSANFDGIAPADGFAQLAISDVFHKTFVAVDENGTEAAAATGIMIGTTTILPNPPIEVRVDRPFLFAIQHRPSGACLFLGRIADPS